jgi:hypothetical protein
MSWLAATFTKYPELAVFLAVGVGYWAGAFKVRGIGLGPVTCSLLVGCLIGYFFKVPVSSTAKSILFFAVPVQHRLLGRAEVRGHDDADRHAHRANADRRRGARRGSSACWR